MSSHRPSATRVVAGGGTGKAANPDELRTVIRTVPAGRHVVKLCCAEACQSRGSRQLVADVESALGVSVGGTTSDGRVTLEAVYCLGNCALSPAALVDGELYGRVDAERVRQLVSASSQ